MENIKKYNSYEDFVNDNIGSKKFVVVYGSGGQSQPLDGATKDSIEKQFKGMIYHEFLDSEFFYNYTSSNIIKDEYKSFVKEFYNSLLESPKEFASFWENNMTKSGDYDSLYELKNKGKNIETNYNYSTGDKRINSESKYVLAIKNEIGQIIKYVPTELPESYIFYIFSKFKNKMSNKLKQEYRDYRKKYAGEDIKLKEGGSIKSKGTFKPFGTAKELGITPNIAEHDMIAKCDCGEKFSYQNSKKNILWQCPECNGMKKLDATKMADGGTIGRYSNMYFGKGYEYDAITELQKALPNYIVKSISKHSIGIIIKTSPYIDNYSGEEKTERVKAIIDTDSKSTKYGRMTIFKTIGNIDYNSAEGEMIGVINVEKLDQAIAEISIQ